MPPMTSPTSWHFSFGVLARQSHAGKRWMHSAEAKRYTRWKEVVRCAANLAGVPPDLDPWPAVYEVSLVVKWEKRARLDTDGVLGAVIDAVFPHDRRVLVLHVDAAHENEGYDMLDVTITRRAGP